MCEQKDYTYVASLLEKGHRGGGVMRNRTCGVLYYAAALLPFLNEKTEVYLVQKVEVGGYSVAVPRAQTDPADSVSVVLWRTPVVLEH